MNTYLSAAIMARHPSLKGNTQKILWYLCDAIYPKTEKEKKVFREKGVAWVVRSRKIVMFRCRCGKNSFASALNELTEIGVLKTKRRGPHEFCLFVIYLNKLLELRVEYEEQDNKKVWLAERIAEIEEAFKKPGEPDPADVLEEEYEYAADSGEFFDPSYDPGDQEPLDEDTQLYLKQAAEQKQQRLREIEKERLANQTSQTEDQTPEPKNKPLDAPKVNAWNPNLSPEYPDSTGLPNSERSLTEGFSPKVYGFSEGKGSDTPSAERLGSDTLKFKKTDSKTSGTSSPNPYPEHTFPGPMGEKSSTNPSLRYGTPSSAAPLTPTEAAKRLDEMPPTGPKVKLCAYCGRPAEEGRLCNKCREHSAPKWKASPPPKPYTGPRCPGCKEPRGNCDANCGNDVEDGML